MKDVAAALALWRFWLPMGLLDVRMRYRRTFGGPWWAVVGTVAIAGVVGLLYGRLFGVPAAEFVPFVATGFAGWSLIASHLAEAPNALVARRTLVSDQHGVALPLLLADVVRRTVMFAHAAFGVVLLAWGFGVAPGWALLLLAPNALLASAALGAWSVVLAHLGALFRDVGEAVALALVPLMLITPVLWKPAQFGLDERWVLLNPLASLLDLLRAPLLGAAPELSSYVVAGAVLLTGLIAATVVTRRSARMLPIWVA